MAQAHINGAVARGIVWDRTQAALGAAYALPAAVAALSDLQTGLALTLGVLPAAIVGLAPTRRGRRVVVVLGTLIGVPLLLGSLLAHVPWLAVAAIAMFGVAAIAYVFGLGIPALRRRRPRHDAARA